MKFGSLNMSHFIFSAVHQMLTETSSNFYTCKRKIDDGKVTFRFRKLDFDFLEWNQKKKKMEWTEEIYVKILRDL